MTSAKSLHDHFGNALTGVRAAILPTDARLAAAHRARTFSDLPPGTAFFPRGLRASHPAPPIPRLSGCGGGQSGIHHLLSLADDGLKVRLVLKALSVDLVDSLGTRRARCEPAAIGDNLKTFDRSAVPRRTRELRDDRLASQVRGFDRLG